MKKTFLGIGLVLSFLCLLVGCGNAVNNNNIDNGPSKPDTTEEKVNLYKSFIGEYTDNNDRTYEIAADKIVIEWTTLNYFDFKKDLYYYDELPDDNLFKSGYIIVDAEPGRIIHGARLEDKEDTDTVSLEQWKRLYYCEISDPYSNRYYDYENDILYEKDDSIKRYEPLEKNNVLYLYKSNYSYLIGLHYNSDDKKITKISVYKQLLPGTATITKISDFKADRVRVNDNGELQIIDIEDDNDLDLLLREYLSDEIENSGLDYDEWKEENESEYYIKKNELYYKLVQKRDQIWDHFFCSVYTISEYSVYKKNSGNDNNDDDNGNGNDDSVSIDPSDFEGYTWKYAHENVSSTTTQNVVFENGTITVTTITESNNSGTTHTNREETASYELDGDKIKITYSKYGYDTTAEYTISVEGNTLTLEGDDNDTYALSLLATLFQNTSGTATISFTRD